ncbi:MAG: N-6 DNA methylase [Chromatiales bacterium]|nr:N-6 DNA methylase [Chromatiales bacterium]
MATRAMNLTGGAGVLPEPLARAIVEDAASSVRKLASSVRHEERLNIARAIVVGMVSAYWKELQAVSERRWPLRRLPSDVGLASVPEEIEEQAEKIGIAAAGLDVLDAGYTIGVLYTALMPDRFRARLGAYYTPPALCERLLDMATEAGVDWGSARVLDPACGGGAFLAPVARRMAASLKDCDARVTLESIQRRLYGFERDSFAAWMSQVFLDVALGDLCGDAGARLRSVVRVCDSLEQKPAREGFDLVVGNPPYGRVTLPPELRQKFRRSLFGHANLYGVFTDLALRFTRPGGVIAYVTPTSFLSGEYFKALRGLLGREAPPAGIDFIGERRGVFADVLQETMLAAYRRGGDRGAGKVHFISARPDGSIERTTAGTFNLPENQNGPWLMPRTQAQSVLMRRVDSLRCRLADYGYTVSTGPLVWNRHKPSLRDRPGRGRYPLVWAESVRAEGVFEFRAEKRNHKPWFEPKAKERWVVTDVPCVLLQRTTAKEQSRRLIAAELPPAFIKEHGAVVVENHLNMIKPLNGAPRVTPGALAVLLNSGVVDQVFRCINGSVAVSAYELEALPLPRPGDIKEIERLVKRRASRERLEDAVERLYVYGDG